MACDSVKGKPDCELCPLHATAQSVCLMGRGSLDADVMVVGEAPGYREDEIGKPFQGRSGKLLDSIFHDLGMKRDEIYITNTVKCRPPDNRTPRPREVKACAGYLEKEVRKVDPRFVLLLGGTAVTANLGGKITETRGKFVEKDGRYYFATFHPAAALRDPKKEKVIRNDLALFHKAVKKGRPIEDKSLNLRIVRSPDDLNECIEDLVKYKAIAYDLETTGLNPFLPESRIVCMGLATQHTQWVIPLYHRESPFKNEEIRQMVVELVHEAIKDKYLIGHNAKFDSLWLLVRHGLYFYCSFDTMLAHYVHDENDQHGLKYLAGLYFGAGDYDISTKEKTGSVPLDKLAKYCGYDVYYTRKLFNKFKKMFAEDDDLWEFYSTVLIPAANTYVKIEATGVYVYEHRLDQAEEFWKERLNDCFNRLAEYIKDFYPEGAMNPLTRDEIPKKIQKKMFNWGSTKMVADLLFNKLGLKVIEKTAKGAPATNESVMKRLAAQHAVPSILLEYREAYKQLSSFISSWKEKIVDSRLHPSFKLLTVTGRTSCVEPNLQQVPRDPRIRTLIGAPPGWTLIEADQSQVELRVAAMVSGDKTMRLAFQTGEDLHTKTARATTGKHELTKEERKKAKAVNFGFLYGMGWRKFIEYARDNYGAHFTEKEAQIIRERFFEAYPGLRPWHERQRRIAKNYGQVRSLVGRIRHLPDAWSEDEALSAQAMRQAINSPVQGFASDLVLMAIAEMSQTFSEEYFKIVGTVHDAILMEVRNDKVGYVLPRVKKIMESPKALAEMGVVLPVPLVADATVGDWGGGLGVEFGNEPPVNEDGSVNKKALWYDRGTKKLRRWGEDGWAVWEAAS